LENSGSSLFSLCSDCSVRLSVLVRKCCENGELFRFFQSSENSFCGVYHFVTSPEPYNPSLESYTLKPKHFTVYSNPWTLKPELWTL